MRISPMSTQDYSEFRERRERSVWHSLNRLLTILIIIVGVVLAAMIFLPQMRRLHEMKTQSAALAAEKERLAAEVQKHQREVDLLKNVPAYVETVMRDKLEMMKPGETIIRMDSVTPAPSPRSTPAR
jgi:cell division protein FtsB